MANPWQLRAASAVPPQSPFGFMADTRPRLSRRQRDELIEFLKCEMDSGNLRYKSDETKRGRSNGHD